MINHRERGIFTELARHFLATPENERECRLWLQGDRVDLPPELQSTLDEIATLSQMNVSGQLENFEVDDTTVVHFSASSIILPALRLTIKDADVVSFCQYCYSYWYSGFIRGLQNITRFLEEIAKQKATVPA